MRLVDYSKKCKENKGDLELRKQYLKRCYEVLSLANCSKTKLEILAGIEGVSTTTIRDNAKKYVDEFIEMNKTYSYQSTIIKYLGMENFKIDNIEELMKISNELVKIYDNKDIINTISKMQEVYKRKYLVLIYKVKLLVFYLKNGIKYEDGSIRKFDILDYAIFMEENFDYLNKYKFNFNYFHEILKSCNLSASEMRILGVFIGSCDLKNNNTEINQILDGFQEINCEKDKHGRVIVGSGRIIERREKEDIINYLISNDVPVNYKNYQIAFKKYIKEMLFNDDVKNKKLINQ